MAAEACSVLIQKWQSHSIEQRVADGYVNATSMARACKRDLCTYMRSKRTAEFCKALSKLTGLQQAQLVHNTQAGGRHEGTWLHPQLATDLARWLGLDFSVWFDAWALLRKTDAAPPGGEGPRPQGRFCQILLLNETDLHTRVVAYLRRFHPDAVLIAGLGELQDSTDKRLDAWAKGYSKGQPDLLVVQRTRSFAGLALEFKTPNCAPDALVVSEHQLSMLRGLEAQGFKTLVSNDYDVLCREVDSYFGEVRRKRRLD